jgi:His Kinase A (phospho-acceptor) domain
MMERGLAVGFCLSDCCIDPSQDAGTDETPDGEGRLHRRDLLQAVDFYAAVLAMASHDLRQPLQVIVSAHELLARRLTARPEREHLERSEQASVQLEKSWTNWSRRCSFTSAPGASNRSPCGSNRSSSALRYKSTDRPGARAWISDSCRRAP